jgi:hypothetical protein
MCDIASSTGLWDGPNYVCCPSPSLPCGVGEMTLEQLLVFVAVERQHVTPRITKEPQREGQEARFD